MEINMKIMMIKVIKANLFTKLKINKKKSLNHLTRLVHAAIVPKNLINILIYIDFLKVK